MLLMVVYAYVVIGMILAAAASHAINNDEEFTQYRDHIPWVIAACVMIGPVLIVTHSPAIIESFKDGWKKACEEADDD